jgi:hypothetical protein
MKLTILLIILTIIIPTAHSTPKSGELIYIGNNKPLALIIGNRSYQYKPLRNTINDAIDIKNILQQIGFEVILKTNLNQSQMDDAIDNFANRLLQSQRTGLFYFSGHGANVAGTNYLLPIDNNRIRRARHLRYYAINTHKILKTMEKGRTNSINIMILDACRDDPFPNRNKSFNRGLGRINTRGCKTNHNTIIPQPIIKPKNYFQDPLKNGNLGPKMTWIPAGSVIMGNKTL